MNADEMEDERNAYELHVEWCQRNSDFSLHPSDPMRFACAAAANDIDRGLGLMVYHQVDAWRQRYEVKPVGNCGAYSGNPVYPLRAWLLCCHCSLPAPTWVARWLTRVASGKEQPPAAQQHARAEALDAAVQIAYATYVPAKRWKLSETGRVGGPDRYKPDRASAASENLSLQLAGVHNRSQPSDLRKMARSIDLRLGLFEMMCPDRLHEILNAKN
jgi:hypothetical protein